MIRGLILEGISGSGKSKLVSRLRDRGPLSPLSSKVTIIEGSHTVGSLLEDARNLQFSDVDRCERLHDLMPKIESEVASNAFVILERLHPSYYSHMPRWDLYGSIDSKLAELGFGIAFLSLPDSAIASRALLRPELETSNWKKTLIDWYGSRDNALAAFRRLQLQTRHCLRLSRLPTLEIDTTELDWLRYEREIFETFKSTSTSPKLASSR